uniref:Matrix Gla protein n=1 Tax=Laticauda laticaudata TaxID=8630 RepID=A0A8C5SBU2_LATLA
MVNQFCNFPIILLFLIIAFFSLLFLVTFLHKRRKTTQELQREECEDYNPCERYAMRHGYVAAYKRFFGQRRGE